MRLAHQERFPPGALGWGAAMNLFSLAFALILAILFALLLLVFVEVVEKKAPRPAPESGHAAEVQKAR